MKPNMIKIRKKVYFVRTQAGFRKAFKEFRKFNEIESKEIYGFPKKYPAMVIFSLGYSGYYFTNCICFYIDQLKDIVALDVEQ